MASVKQAWIRKYGEEVGLQMWEERKKQSRGNTKEKLREKYGDEYVKELSRKKNTFSLEGCINKYGEIEGPKKWEARLKRKQETQKEHFKGKKWNNGRTLEEYQKRYGVKEGYDRWKKRNNHHSYMISLQRYLDEYGEQGYEMIAKLKSTVSLDSTVSRLGEIEGIKRYEEYIKTCKLSSKRSIDYWLKHHDGDSELAKASLRAFQSVTLEKLVERYGEVVGKKRYLSWIEKCTSHPGAYSKVSQALFWQLYKELGLSEHYTKFHELNKEETFYRDNKIIKVDFKYKNKIIEFNGDYWHANPKLYSESDTLFKSRKASSIWEKDRERISWLESVGYRVLVVWEKDWNTTRDLIFNNCKNFILNE